MQNIVLILRVSGLPLVHSSNWVIISLTHIWAKHTSKLQNSNSPKMNRHSLAKNNSIRQFFSALILVMFLSPKNREGKGKKEFPFVEIRAKRVVYFLHFCPELCKKKPLDCLDCWPDSELENV